MTRIAVVHNLKAGGAARRLTGTLNEWHLRREVTLRVFTFAGAATVGPPALASDLFELDWYPLAPQARRVSRPVLRYVDARHLARGWKQLASEVNAWKPDVVFGNPCRYVVGANAAIRWLQWPSVLYVDEARRFDYETGGRDQINPFTRLAYGPLYTAYRDLDRSAVLAATMVVSNSDFSSANIARAYGRTASVFPPGVDPMFRPKASRSAQSMREPQFVLSVGSLIPSKAHDLAIEAVSRTTETLQLVVVAPRDEPAERLRLQQIARRVGVDLTLKFGIGDTALVDLYRRATCCVYLARAEPLGLASLESQACGTPVVVADEGGLRETVEPGTTGARVDRTADAVADGINRVVGDRDRMARACRARPPLTASTAATNLLTACQTAADTPVGAK